MDAAPLSTWSAGWSPRRAKSKATFAASPSRLARKRTRESYNRVRLRASDLALRAPDLVQAFQPLFLHIQCESANDSPRQGRAFTSNGGDDLHNLCPRLNLLQGRHCIFDPADSDDLNLTGGRAINVGNLLSSQPAEVRVVAAQSSLFVAPALTILRLEIRIIRGVGCDNARQPVLYNDLDHVVYRGLAEFGGDFDK